MKPFRWNHEKNEQLKAERNISFEEIVLAIEADGLLDIIVHSNPGKLSTRCCCRSSPWQYAYLVPFVERTEYYFLKTVIPNRKATRDYLKGGV